MRENETNTEKTLMEETQCLKHEFDVLRNKNVCLEAEISEARSKIKFLEGQIEAYQYCMNCRRN